MGGFGSGGSRYDRRTQVEECLRLEVSYLHRQGMLRDRQTYSGGLWWTKNGGERVANISVETSAESVRLTYTVSRRDGRQEPESIDYTVPVVWTPCNYGGKRPWFLCPGNHCGRRVGKLYMPRFEHARYFVCRHCYGLSYASRSWDGADRAYEKAWRIAERLGGKAGLANGFPPRPRGMHLNTYLELGWEYAHLTHLGLILMVSRFDKSFAAGAHRPNSPSR
jgi:hypothetical protein